MIWNAFLILISVFHLISSQPALSHLTLLTHLLFAVLQTTLS